MTPARNLAGADFLKAPHSSDQDLPEGKVVISGMGNKIFASKTLGLTKQEKLRHSRQFEQIYRRGRRLTGPHLTMYFQPNGLNFSRFGLAVSKRRVKLSTQRHYFRRRLREAYRRNKLRFVPGYDIAIGVNRTLGPDQSRKDVRADRKTRCAPSSKAIQMGKSGKARHFAQLQKELLFLAQKARLLK